MERLAALAHPEGGWGYVPGQAAHLEPTCFALLALSLQPDRYAEAIRRGQELVHTGARSDGAYRLPGDREESIWTTALVLFLNAVGAVPRKDLASTVSRLLAWEGRKP